MYVYYNIYLQRKNNMQRSVSFLWLLNQCHPRRH